MKRIRTVSTISLFLLAWALPLLGQTVKTESFQGRDVVSGEIIVRFRVPDAAAARTVAAQDADIASTEQVGQGGAMLLRSQSRSVSELVQAYAGRADVLYAEPNYIWHQSDIPNDPSFGQQWGLQNTGQRIGFDNGIAGADIHAVQAWNTTVGSRGIVVGVIDSGIDYTHPDLLQNLWSPSAAFNVTISGQVIHCAVGTHGFNAITRTCDPMDDNSHGTHVSGIIGATGNNLTGVTGVSRLSSIMALKFLDSTGNGKTSDAIAAIEFAIQVKSQTGVNVRVLNASWGGAGFSQSLLDEINSANANNMLFVAAAGNNGTNSDLMPDYPASFDAANIISVASTNNRDGLDSFSNFGAITVNIGAPGADILSTLPSNAYGLKTGTSMAAPMVSGAAALTLAACSSLSTPVLKSDLLNSVDQIASLVRKTSSGGRLNVAQAIGECTGTGSGTFHLSSDRAIYVTGAGSSVTAVITVTGINGFNGTVSLSASNLSTGFTAAFSPATITGSGSTTLTLTVAPNVSQGAIVQITGTSGAITQVIGITLYVAPRIPLGQIFNSSLGSNPSTNSLPSQERPGSPANYYWLTLASDTLINIDMHSPDFDAYLYLLSTFGSVLISDDDSGGGQNARIGPVLLPAGNYVIETTSFDPGASGVYFVLVNGPTIDTIVPASGQAGTSVNVTVSGNRFVAPVTFNTPGITVTNISVIDTHTITATFVIGQGVAGVKDISIVSGGATSNTVPFTVTPAVPVLTSLSPSLVSTGSTVSFLMTGFGLVSGMTVDAGDGITANGISASNTSASAALTIATTASAGTHNVTVTTSAGTSNALPLIVTNQPPVITGISPAFGTIGAFLGVALTGTNFTSPMTVDVGSGISVFGSVSVSGSTRATMTFAISDTAALGPRNLTVSTGSGTSNPVTFTINPVFATLSSINPNQAGQGSSVDVTLSGSGFNLPMTVNAGSDITVTNLVLTNAFSAKATLVLSNTATLGVRNVTVTTSVGTSNSLSFTVVPAFPDLAITDSRAGNFGVGFNENYVVTVTNRGSAPTTAPTTVTYDFSNITFVSGTGAGWSCSLSTTTRVTCVNPGIIAAGAQSTITLTVAVGDVLSTIAFATFAVSTTGDSNATNNSVTDNTTVVRFSSLNLSASPTSWVSGLQVTTGVSINNPFPHPLTGTLTLTFVPASGLADDPAIQFSTGGRQVAFVIPANSPQALIAGNVNVGFQTGTVAGTLTLRATIQSAGTVQPPAISPISAVLPQQAPSITKITKDPQSGFAALITLFSNTREASSMTFTFNTTPSVRLSCGTVSGCTASGSSITFDVQSLFSTWYAADTTFGGAATLRVPFVISGTLVGSITVSLRNSRGMSNVPTLVIP